MTPKFSIVIPTRNRPHLLRHALATALAQRHDDFEVVVSDNASGEETRAVVEAADDPRVRYVRSDVPLSNAGSFEFAISHAAGEWVTTLGDDDGFVPSFLSRVEPVLPREPGVVGWRTAYYVHPDNDPPWPVEAERNVLTVEPHSGCVTTIDGADQLRRLFQRREIDPIPSVKDGIVHRSLLDELARSGGVFGEPDPGWAVAVGLLTLVPSYAVIGLPLSVTGCSTSQVGGSMLTNARSHSIVREFDRDDLFVATPLHTRTCVNVVAETLLRSKERFARELDAVELDLVRYFVGSRLELSDARRIRDDGAALAEWRSVLAQQPAAVRAKVRVELTKATVRAEARSLARRVGPVRAWRGKRLLSVDGTEAGFDDLLGAADHLDRVVLGGSDYGSTRVVGMGTTN